VRATEVHAATRGEQARDLQPSDCFLAAAPAPSGQTQAYRLASQGLSLGEIARRLPMRRDRLTRQGVPLVSGGALRAADSIGIPAVAPRLTAGQIAPDFRLTDISGEPLRLSDLRGQPVWLLFGRHSTCTLCTPRHAQIIALSEHLQARGVQIVSVWGSGVAELQQGVGVLRPPYPVLADPDDTAYEQYGLSMSLRGALDGRNLPTLIQGLRMVGVARSLRSDGELLRMPAEFLIGPDGEIQQAHYNGYGADWLPLKRVLAWADALPCSPHG